MVVRLGRVFSHCRDRGKFRGNSKIGVTLGDNWGCFSVFVCSGGLAVICGVYVCGESVSFGLRWGIVGVFGDVREDGSLGCGLGLWSDLW